MTALHRWGVVYTFILLIIVDNTCSAGIKSIGHENLESEIVFHAEKMQKDGEFRGAIELLNESLCNEIFNNDKKFKLTAYLRLGSLYWNIGSMKISEECYMKALSYSEALGQSGSTIYIKNLLKINSYYSSGKRYRESDRLYDGIESFKKGIDIALSIESQAHELKLIRQLSLIYWKQSDYSKYFDLNRRSLYLAQILNHPLEISRAMNNLGLFYWKMNKYSQALVYFHSALSLINAKDIIENKSNILNNLGVIYQEIGYQERAIDLLKKALSIDLVSANDFNIASDYMNIGTAYSRITGNRETNIYRAISAFFNCYNIAYFNRYLELEIMCLINIGVAYSRLNRFEKSLFFYKLGSKKIEYSPNFELQSMLNINIGDAYRNINAGKNAEKLYTEAISNVNGWKSPWEAFYGLGRIYEAEYNFEDALCYYKQAVDIIDKTKNNMLIDVNIAGFVRDKITVYESLLRVLFQLSSVEPNKNYDEEMFKYSEKSKARTFYDGLNESYIRFEEVCRLSSRRNIKGFYNILQTYLSGSNIDFIQRTKDKIETEIMKSEEEYKNQYNKNRQNYLKSNIQVNSKINDVFIVQKYLNKSQAILEYSVGEEISFLFVISKNTFKVVRLKERSRINRSLRAYLKLLSYKPEGPFRGGEASYRLYQELVEVGVKYLGYEIKQLIIIPDENLYQLPFETLCYKRPKNNTTNSYLVSKYEISYISSVASLILISKRSNRKSFEMDFIAFGNPEYNLNNEKSMFIKYNQNSLIKKIYCNQGFELERLPYSLKEIQGIIKLFKRSKSQAFVNENAKESIVKLIDLSKYRIIHFACHGLVNKESPYQSALVLSLKNCSEEDGFLSAKEILNLCLDADLVVLSACQSGRGSIDIGEGVFGLPRVFFFSGAKSVISTLWKIEDEASSDLMIKFYSNLIRGVRKSKALQEAKMFFIDSKNAHPYYWAAFVLNGDNSSINFN